MSMLEQAIALALRAHAGQLDRAGRPYILHPLRVMCRLRAEPDQIAAVLHDVVEDTPVTLDDLRREGFPEAIVTAVDCLTKRPGRPYEELIERAMANPIARRVKLADLEDNMDILRSRGLVAEDLARLERYRRAWHRLTGEVTGSV